MIELKDLTSQDYTLLSCSKKGWNSDGKAYQSFMNVLKRYIALFGTASCIDFVDINFPQIYINDKLLRNRGFRLIRCDFHGKVIFENITFLEQFDMQMCECFEELSFRNIVFEKEVNIMENIYHKKTIFENITFLDTINFYGLSCKESILFKNFTFHNEAEFSNIFVKNICMIRAFKSLEFFQWDELFCVYNIAQYDWNQREEYLQNYLKEDSILDLHNIKIVEEIKTLFPEDAKEIDKRLIETTDTWSCYFFIEYFADITGVYLKRKNYIQAKAHLKYIETKFNNAEDKIAKILNDGYVENILYQLNPKERKEVWEHIPKGIQERYIRIWGRIK